MVNVEHERHIVLSAIDAAELSSFHSSAPAL